MSLGMTATTPQIVSIALADPGDVTLEVIQYTDDSKTERLKTGLIRAERAKIIEHTNYFDNMFSPDSNWRERTQAQITLEEDNVTSMEVWLRAFHSQLPDMSLDSVTVADIWQIIVTGDKYDFDLEMLISWFRNWWTAKSKGILDNVKECCMMLFPAYKFDHASAFRDLTKKLVYGMDEKIAEINPTSLLDRKLPDRAIEQMNAAKGRLRNILEEELSKDYERIVSSSRCSCRDKTVCDYMRQLGRIGVWPMRKKLRDTSIHGLLARLEKFTIGNTRCQSCAAPDWRAIVRKAATHTNEYFDGLCLDCMHRSEARLHLDDDDLNFHHVYSPHCRTTHGQPTRYFSSMRPA
ncbi:hypothetical protein FQN52_002545 [Onygenales sp. PD_12]|nr:hypothetical protein FQN52_002545 [Onygenales sp. PD_12]